jgi:energy-coupling factor transport system permease protein
LIGSAAQRSVFAGYHPLLNYLWFAYVILVPIFFFQPMVLVPSFVSALAYSLYLGRGRAVRFALCFVLPLMLLAALFNPLFNHRGATILFYLHYNPITLESIIYGAATALMLGSVLLWFTCYNALMTSDRFLYLFGRVVPAMSLIFSMALRLVPRYQVQAARIASARRGIGFDVASGNLLARVKSGGEIVSVMVTWALENGIETGDSMLARGWGLPGRTAYSNYRFDTRDRVFLPVLVVLAATSLVALISGAASVLYYPLFTMENIWPLAQVASVCHGVLCVLPLALEVREDLLWRSLRSGI